MDSPEAWWREADVRLRNASKLLAEKDATNFCYQVAGAAIEFAMKGAIMKTLRLNRWPALTIRAASGNVRLGAENTKW